MKEIHEMLMEAIKKLGIPGSIAYFGALILFFAVTRVDFTADQTKALFLTIIGVTLLFFSGIIYWVRSKEDTEKTKEGLGVLREIYNRLAEQISTADKDKTVAITMTINNLPDKIVEVIEKTKLN